MSKCNPNYSTTNQEKTSNQKPAAGVCNLERMCQVKCVSFLFCMIICSLLAPYRICDFPGYDIFDQPELSLDNNRGFLLAATNANSLGLQHNYLE